MKFRLLFTLLILVFTLVACGPTEVEKDEFTVTFEVNGGSVIEAISVLDGELVLEPAEPTKATYTFVGWFTDLTLTEAYDFSTPVTGNIKLYAKWVADVAAQIALMDADAAAISFSDDPITAFSLNLPLEGSINGSKITWTSSNTAVVNRHGIVFHPRMGEDDVSLTLTAKLTFGLQEKFYTYDVTIAAKTEVLMDESVSLPFTNLTSEYEVADGNLMTFFAENQSLPYVDIMSFMELLDGLVYYEDLEFSVVGNIMTIYYQYVDEIEDDLGNVIDTETYDYYLYVDFDLNTVTVETLDFFGGYIQETATDYGKGLTYLETYYEEGQDVVIDMEAYRFDLVVHEEGGETYYLFPFHLANLLFTGGSYYNVYYNGNGYFGIYAFPDNDDPAGSTEDGEAYNTMKVSSLNGTNIAPDVLVATYDMLVLTLDYFYGLKDVRGVESYYDAIQSTRDSMMTGKVRDLGNGLFNIVNKTLDDLHSYYYFPGYYETPTFKIELTNIAQVGPKVRQWYDVLWEVQDLLEVTYPTNPNNEPPAYRFIDNNKTAIIYLSGFETATVEDPDGPDSDRYMSETLQAIRLENPNVENIVIDLSYNTGGNLGALLRVLGYMTEEPIEMHYMNPTDGSRTTYFIEVETEALTTVNWFFITSKVTFSAANLMASIGKDMGIATLIGTTSGGGASSIIPVVLPDGSFFHMSSLNVLSYRVGNDVDGYTYYSIEEGVEPDYILEVEDTQSAAKIAEVIAEALADQAG